MQTNNLKVLEVSSTYPYLKNHNNPRFINQLCNNLNLSLDIHILAPSIKGAPSPTKNINLFRYCFKGLELLTGGSGINENLKSRKWLYFVIPLFFISQLHSYIKLILRLKIDIVHVHWIIPQGITALIAKKIFNIKTPFILSIHGGDLYTRNSKILYLIKKSILKEASHITVVSEDMKNYCLNTFGVSKEKISVLPMGVDLTNTFVPKPKITTDKITLLFIGRLVEKKGVTHLIEAAEPILKKSENIVLKIVGSGHLDNKLRKKCNELGLNNQVRFMGAQEHSNLPNIIQNADIVILPFVEATNGDKEGLGLTTIEALGCEKPVIAGNVSAVHDVIIHRKTGYIVNPLNYHEFTLQIEDILGNLEIANKIAIKGRNYVVNKYDWGLISKKYCILLNSIAANKNDT